MYDIVLTDMAGTPQGQVPQVSNLQYFRGLSKVATLSFTVPMSNPHAARLAALTGYVKLFRKGVIQFFGPLISSEENAERETRSISVTCADPGWTWTKRITAAAVNGTVWTTPTPRHTIVKSLADTANVGYESGIDTSNFVWSSGSSITYKAGPWAMLLPTIQELGNAVDGFDWFLWPSDNWVNGARVGFKIANMQVATLIGSAKPDAVFEYGAGTRSNVVSYSKSVSRDQQATRAYHLSPDATSAVSSINSTAEATWGITQDIIQADITDTAARQSLVDAHTAVRGNPRTIVKFTPHIDPGDVGHVPEPFVDYNIGDTVTFRATDAGTVKFSGLLRVYGIRTSIDERGFERVELITEDE